MLLAREEETKRKAQVVKKKNSGPSVKWRSRKGADGEEHVSRCRAGAEGSEGRGQRQRVWVVGEREDRWKDTT